MMEKVANAILKHSKLIIVLWIVLLLVASPFVYKYIENPRDVVKYEITDMEGADSESYSGMKILKDKEYFDSSNNDYIVVMKYNDAAEKEKLDNLIVQLTLDIQDHWKEKGDTGCSRVEKIDGMTLFIVTLPQGATDKNAGVDFVRDDIKKLKDQFDYHNDTYLTGNVALGYDISKSAMNDVKKIDPFSILLVLILIGLFFRSIISAATPPLTIGVAYAVVLMAVFGIAMISDVFYITTTLVLISMLGAGCDYCIFIIARYREERKLGKSQDDSLREAIMWAGESVTISGLCVIIGFGVMSLCSFSLVKTMGLILAVGIIFALLAAITLIPSIIHLVGDKIFYPTKVESYMEGSEVSKGWYGKIGKLGQRYFRSSARFSIKHAWAIVVVALVITAPLAYVAMTEKTSFDMVSTMPDGESKQGIDAITNSGMGGMTMPTHVVLDLQDTNLITVEEKDYGGVTFGTLKWNNLEESIYLMKSTWYMSAQIGEEQFILEPEGVGKAILDKNNDNISSMMGVMNWYAFVTYIQNEMGGSQYIPYSVAEGAAILMLSALSDDLSTVLTGITVMLPGDDHIQDRAGIIDYMINMKVTGALSNPHEHQYVKMTIMFKDQPMSDTSMKTAELIREGVHDYQNTEEGKALIKDSYTTGTTALMNDISDQVQGDFRIIEIVVILLIVILLMLVMKSYFTPIRSVVTIIMSILWTLGFTHLLYGHVLGQPIIWLIPIVLFVVCLGLGMDYDVLLTTRIKEYVGKGMDNDTAIEQAVEHSGAIITICGLIMGGAFLTMTLSSTPMLAQFGFALGFAILVDALLIRTYVVPAVMHLMGKWNWVGPKFRYRKDVE